MAASAVVIEVAPFLDRTARLREHMQKNREVWGEATAALFATGKASTSLLDESYSVTLQKLWLAYEFPETIILLTSTELYFFASPRKLDHLKPLVEAAVARGASYPLKITLVAREKGEGTNDGAHATLADAVARSGGVLATVPDNIEPGTPMHKSVEAVKGGSKVVECGKALESYWAVKDATAVDQVTKAGQLVARVCRNVFVADMEEVVDKEEPVSNAQLAAKVEAAIDDLAARGVKVDTDNFDITLKPVVQSGGDYNVHAYNGTVSSNDKPFSADVINITMAMRYRMFHALVARTYMVDPTPSQVKAYEAVLTALASLVDKMRPGAVIADVVTEVRDGLVGAEGMPMEAKLMTNFGCGYGQRLTDKALALTTRNRTVLEPGMVFSVWVGLSEIPLTDVTNRATAMSKLSSYAIFLADTLVITDGLPLVVTDKVIKERSKAVYHLAEEEEVEEVGGGRSGAGDGDGGIGRRSTRQAARKKESEEDEEARKRREAHQAILFEKKKEEGRRALLGGGGAAGGAGGPGDDLSRVAPITAYKSSAEYPRGGRLTQVIVDKAHDCVLVPMLGTLVPFHVSTIKSVVKSEEGHKAFLRLNFYTPGTAPGKDCPPSMQAALMEHAPSIFIKTVNFVSKDHRNMNNVSTLVKAMQKKAKTEREDEKNRSGLVEQQKLVLLRVGHVPQLEDVTMWPSISGRKTQGTLEGHANGLRFTSTKSERIEIIYGNIRHAIFQPCHNEHIVLLHFHLKHPIMIGKKKFKDVQFFTEVVEAGIAIEGRHRSDFDGDDAAEEERERRVRLEMNKFFKRFAERVEDIAEKDSGGWHRFDMPQRDLVFPGAPNREMVNVSPCTDCLVALVDKPPFVASVDDIEHVHFERVSFSNKDFDMIIIFKAGTREKGQDEFVRISAIPMKDLDMVKKWLDEVAEVTYTEGVGTFQWKGIIEDVVRSDAFYMSENPETGSPKLVGWDFLRDEAYEEEGEGEEEESEFSEEEEDEEEEEEDDDDEEFDEDEEDEEDEDDEDEDEDDDGDDWDELDRKAEEEDRKRSRKEFDGEDRAGKKHAKTAKRSRRD